MSDPNPAPVSNSLKVPVSLANFLVQTKYSNLELLAKTSTTRSLVFTSMLGWRTKRVERVALVQAEDTERLKVFDGVVAAMEHWDSSSEILFETIAEAVENMK